jgi:uncharacterized protein
MRTENQRESANVEDRRGMSKGAMAAGGGIGALIIALIVMLMGGDPSQLLSGSQAGGPAAQEAPPLPDDEETQAAVKLVKVVLASTEDVFGKLLPAQKGQPYVEPKLVLFSGMVQSGCGRATSATGPFYCPADNDQKVYLDTSFFADLARKFGAPGDFAQAYVIAHEVGHHLQKLLGASDYVNQHRGRVSEAEQNRLSVRLELQADFYAGVWAHHAQKQKRWLEEGDLEEALEAANAIGDDRLQKQGQGYVVPDSFTHGTSEQRIRWFSKGFKTGDMRLADEAFSLRYEQL